MRENLRLYKTMPLRELIDRSINQVLMRCLFTSLATFLAMLPMAVWGGRSVENFAIPLVVGVVIATTSSIYIAAPILLRSEEHTSELQSLMRSSYNVLCLKKKRK